MALLRMNSIHSVCVFCGSRTGTNPRHSEIAGKLGHILAKANIQLVFGGGGVGLMNEVAVAAMAAGGKVVGIIPDYLAETENAIGDLTEQIIVTSLDERKKLMFIRADAFIALPGGIGTLDEVLDVFLWRQVGLHDKPLILVNQDQFWDPLIALLDHHHQEGFSPKMGPEYFTVVDTISDVLPALKAAPEPKFEGKPGSF